jgi:hypothetical protein
VVQKEIKMINFDVKKEKYKILCKNGAIKNSTKKTNQNQSKTYFRTGDISTRRLKLWEESFEELLYDQMGRETLQRFLDKEYSGENLRFWWEVGFL